MPPILLLVLLTTINGTNNFTETDMSFSACNFTNDYSYANIRLFEDKGHVLQECQTIKRDDQKLRGIDRELMNDVQNILKLSVILKNNIESKEIIELEVIQSISIVLQHNPEYFTKYFHKPLLEIVDSNRCNQEGVAIILKTIYKKMFGQNYIDNETRFHTQLERNLVMKERIKEEIDPKLQLKELCLKVDSFLTKKISFHEGKVVGKWRRLRVNEDVIITMREKTNGDLYIIRTNFDSAFPSIKKVIRIKENVFKYETPYSNKVWEISQNGSLDFKYREEDSKKFNYPIYREK